MDGWSEIRLGYGFDPIPFDELGGRFTVKVAQIGIRPDGVCLGEVQTALLERAIVAAELAHKTKKPSRLRQMCHERQVASRERFGVDTTQDIAPFDPPTPVDEPVDVLVIAPHVIGAKVDIAVCRAEDSAPDGLSNQQERALSIVKLASAGESGDPAPNDDRFVGISQCYVQLPACAHAKPCADSRERAPVTGDVQAFSYGEAQ